jgi:hypothetical protein
MIFHITHQHSELTCPAHDADLNALTFGKVMEALREPGIEVKGFYVNAPAHRVFLIVETDSIEVINKALYPALKIGTAEIEPVADGATTAKAFEDRARN